MKNRQTGSQGLTYNCGLTAEVSLFLSCSSYTEGCRGDERSLAGKQRPAGTLSLTHSFGSHCLGCQNTPIQHCAEFIKALCAPHPNRKEPDSHRHSGRAAGDPVTRPPCCPTHCLTVPINLWQVTVPKLFPPSLSLWTHTHTDTH